MFSKYLTSKIKNYPSDLNEVLFYIIVLFIVETQRDTGSGRGTDSAERRAGNRRNSEALGYERDMIDDPVPFFHRITASFIRSLTHFTIRSYGGRWMINSLQAPLFDSFFRYYRNYKLTRLPCFYTLTTRHRISTCCQGLEFRKQYALVGFDRFLALMPHDQICKC